HAVRRHRVRRAGRPRGPQARTGRVAGDLRRVPGGVSAMAPGPVVFGVLRFCAGLGLGDVLPLAATISAEYAPCRWRSAVVMWRTAHERSKGKSGHEIENVGPPAWSCWVQVRAFASTLACAARNSWEIPAFRETRSKPWKAPSITSCSHATPAAVRRLA